jgi:predicted TIM-barrel fold metal-dependent hydrolase
VYSCFWFENKTLIQDIERLGYDKVMFETDFPHPTCLYPDPMGTVSRTLETVSPENRRKVLGGNAARVYNISVPGD